MSRRRKRFRDVEHVREKGQRVPRGWRERHSGRLGIANREFDAASIGFSIIGATVERHNDGHHWIIMFPDGRLRRWEWWPSSAKLVAEKQWRKGIHVHSWQNVVKVIREKRAQEQA